MVSCSAGAVLRLPDTNETSYGMFAEISIEQSMLNLMGVMSSPAAIWRHISHESSDIIWLSSKGTAPPLDITISYEGLPRLVLI